MKSISYSIENLNATGIDDIRTWLESLPDVVEVSLTYQEESQTLLAVLTCDSSTDEEYQLLCRRVEEGLASLGCSVSKPTLPTTPPATKQADSQPKVGRQVSLFAAVGSVITAVVVAVLLTFALTTLYHQDQWSGVTDAGQGTQAEDDFAQLDLIHQMFMSMSPLETDKQALLEAVISAYVDATGDRYAEYYDKEAYAELIASQNGEMCGIGVTVVNDVLVIDGQEYKCITIAGVYQNSPAEASGLLAGDAIMYIGVGEDKQSVHELGYTQALADLKGEEGSMAQFVVCRKTDNPDEPYQEIAFNVKREKIIIQAVTYEVCQTNDKVGVVRISTFDNTTAPEFKVAMDALMAQGCQSFVIDLRNNGGGLLTSVEDLLIYFLQSGDVTISTKDKYGREEVLKVGAVSKDGYVQSGTGKLKEADLGVYRGLPLVVLVNENTASAAELFTANIRDYELGQVVGVTTYGKGSMQTYYGLAQYGYEGALKLTTRYYFPPSGEGYDGVGITPHVEVEMAEDVANQNLSLIPHEKDTQLQAAVDLLYP